MRMGELERCTWQCAGGRLLGRRFQRRTGKLSYNHHGTRIIFSASGCQNNTNQSLAHWPRRNTHLVDLRKAKDRTMHQHSVSGIIGSLAASLPAPGESKPDLRAPRTRGNQTTGPGQDWRQRRIYAICRFKPSEQQLLHRHAASIWLGSGHGYTVIDFILAR